ncbi:MAG TPA: aminotransferase [Ferrovibrio sp.]|jgi:N-succinyldiaminopimelate aminotransferase|uniref:aminotransferase n=1 Tax=Ferrovibrio sp. TaxID=1917215 RepID=UPI002B4B366C|nr:aminotransferase [Ferrovibrio sp.]HLT78421.1 aminotransferase [Ferrovibrio sp.]
MNPIFAEAPTTIFETMSRLAGQHNAINLGQGFPDDPGPQDVREKAAEAVISGWNQYPPMMGLPELRQAVAAHYRRFHNLDLDPDTEVMITSGATEALAGALLALIEPGDEVVLFQPMYDAYLPLVRRAGGVPKFVTLRPPHWRIDEDALKAVFTDKTRAVIFNNPLNPTATVFPREDLELLGRYLEKFNAIAICDEVWEHVLFDGLQHQPLIGLPGLRERCVKIGSAGKIFSLTGWKVGFVCAAPQILKVLGKAHQYITFTTPPNLQAAVAYGLAKDDAYFLGMRRDLQAARDRFTVGLSSAGIAVLPSKATYFLNIDLAPIANDIDDAAFCLRMVEEAKVAAIPVSAFYAEDHVRSVVRFCFAKTTDKLDGAVERLAAFMKRG